MHIIFSEDEEIHDNTKLDAIEDNSSTVIKLKSNKSTEDKKKKRNKENVSEAWFAARFE